MPITIQFPMYQNPPIIFADISAYNADRRNLSNIIHFDFDAYWSMGCRIITIRGGVNAAGLDYEFSYNAQTADDMGLWFDVYNAVKLWKNLDTQASIIKDAWDFASTYDHFIPYFWLDIEKNDELNKTQMASNGEKLINKLINLGVPVRGIYTRAYFWNDNFEKTGFFKDFDYWIAHYWTGINIFSVPLVRPYLPDEWVDINNPVLPIKWQVDTFANGSIFGSRGVKAIDISMFTYRGGTYDMVEDYYGVDIDPGTPPPPPPPPSEDWAIMAVDNMSIRSSPEYFPVSDPNGNLFGQGILNRKVKVIGEETEGYVPVEAWVWNRSLRRIT